MSTNTWLATVHLADLFAPGADPVGQREEIARRVRASGWPSVSFDPGRLEYVVADLVAASPAVADLRWQTLLTLADREGVRLET